MDVTPVIFQHQALASSISTTLPESDLLISVTVTTDVAIFFNSGVNCSAGSAHFME
jgi:hypothetical protein